MDQTTQQNYSIYCLGIKYSEKNSSCKREVKRRQMEFDRLISRKTDNIIKLLRMEIAIHDRFRSHYKLVR